MLYYEGQSSCGSHLAQLIGQQVPQQQSLGGVSDQVTVFAHDFHFLHLVAVIRLENHPGACGEVPNDDLEGRKRDRGRVRQVAE